MRLSVSLTGASSKQPSQQPGAPDAVRPVLDAEARALEDGQHLRQLQFQRPGAVWTWRLVDK
jgi:hypothetical protein